MAAAEGPRDRQSNFPGYTVTSRITVSPNASADFRTFLHRRAVALAGPDLAREWHRHRPREARRKPMDVQTNAPTDDEPTVEQLELEWWEPLSCKCDVDFEE